MNNTAKVISIQEHKIEEAAARYKEAKTQVATLKKELDALKTILQEYCSEDTTKEAGRFTIVHTTRKSRNLDTTTLKKELPELWTEYGKDQISHYIEVM